MNEQPVISSDNRHIRAGKFFARAYRYRKMFLRRWWVLLLCAGLGLAAEMVYLHYAPPGFVSVGQMIVSIKLNISQDSLYTEELGNFTGTQAQLMHGQDVLKRAQDRVASEYPKLVAMPVLIDVSVLPRTTIFVLRATGENPDYTKAYLQACMEEYIELKKQMVAHTSDTTIAGLTEQMGGLDRQIKKSDDAMQAFLNTNDIALLQEAGGLGGYLISLYQQLANAQSEADLLQTMTLDQSLLLEQAQTPVMAGQYGAGNAADNSVLVNAGMEGQSGLLAPTTIGTEYLTVKQQILLLKADRDRYAEYLLPKHPQMVALDQELDKLGQVLEIYRQQSLEQLEARKNALALQITNLVAQTVERGRENLVLSRKAAQYARLKAGTDRLQELYDQLLATLQTLDVNKEISPESVTIYQPASPAYQDKTVLDKYMILAGVIGFVLGLVVLLLLDRVDDRMNSFTELEELFDENVLGQIPRERVPGRKAGIIPVLQPNDQRHPFVEAYRNLRSSLLYMTHTEPRPRTLLVTSSVPGDGKSLTATNLAITMAMGGSRVLLVDADLRKGNLQKRLNVEAETGFTEVFLQGADWHQAVRETPVAGLSLLPRGAVTQRSSEFFIGPIMDKFLKESGKEYDYVVIDTAPVMAADDVTSLAPRADGVIFVVRAEHTSSRVAHASLNMLYQRKANVLGLVFNSVHVGTGDYYYYYRYKDYAKG